MPLYQHKTTGERKRTVPGQYEDRRVSASDEWELIPPQAPAPAPAAAPESPGPDNPSPARSRRAASTD